MTRHILIILTSILTIFWRCGGDDRKAGDGSKFPEVKKLNAFKQTEFLPTLEHSISNDRNAVYASTFLFAWNEIKQKVEQPMSIDNSLTDLNMVNNSKLFVMSMKPDECNTSVEVDGDLIRATAEFSKSLPFELKLTSFTNQLIFAGKKVASFGQLGYDFTTSEIIQVLYYKDDNNFIIKLSPKDKGNEIILFKSNDTYKSMDEILPVIASKSHVGKKEKESEKNYWRYSLTDDDEVVIPKFKFNIENNYPLLEGITFKGGNQKYLIETAYQRTAFILDESGAEIESDAKIVCAMSEEMEEETKPHPKKMRFDKPFFVIMKRTDCNNPYFVLWACNTELMVSEE